MSEAHKIFDSAMKLLAEIDQEYHNANYYGLNGQYFQPCTICARITEFKEKHQPKSKKP